MKQYLIIGIRAKPLYVLSIQGELKNKNDRSTAQKIIEDYMRCKVDHVLIIDEAEGMFAPAQVVTNFDTK